ncbi:MAG TPA: NUDIX domain-containing protein [Pseudonocardiaceae bacterium]|nr:NUDIX domain-containing protein [Pseudonocardiaceae bacterium]
MADIAALVRDIRPMDELGEAHRAETLAWLASTDDVFRRVKPRTPSPHLVCYCLLVDRAAGAVLLCDHRLAGLWLPTGGHVEPGEDPWATVAREVDEELGVVAVPDPLVGGRPFFVTVTETVGAPETRHVDVTLWFALAGHVGQALRPDDREFAALRWWPVNELREGRFEPHLPRALAALGLT